MPKDTVRFGRSTLPLAELAKENGKKMVNALAI
jgi:hypothetical protein